MNTYKIIRQAKARYGVVRAWIDDKLPKGIDSPQVALSVALNEATKEVGPLRVLNVVGDLKTAEALVEFVL